MKTFEYEGKEYTARQLSEKLKISRQMVYSRAKAGTPFDSPKRTPSQCGQLARRRSAWGRGSTLRS